MVGKLAATPPALDAATMSLMELRRILAMLFPPGATDPADEEMSSSWGVGGGEGVLEVLLLFKAYVLTDFRMLV